MYYQIKYNKNNYFKVERSAKWTFSFSVYNLMFTVYMHSESVNSIIRFGRPCGWYENADILMFKPNQTQQAAPISN